MMASLLVRCRQWRASCNRLDVAFFTRGFGAGFAACAAAGFAASGADAGACAQAAAAEASVRAAASIVFLMERSFFA
jgi:hypothetical protein